MKNANAARRWAKDLYRRHQSGAASGKHTVELFAALTPEARADLEMEVLVAVDELRDAYRGDSEFMPPCRFRFVRWLATFLNSPFEDEVCEYLMFTSDSAWSCPCRSCQSFADRVDAGTRRFVAAMHEAAEAERGQQ